MDIPILVAAVMQRWQPGYVRVNWTVVSMVTGLALLGEVLKFILGAARSR